MSIRALSDAITDLPYGLSEQVLSYARSLDVAAPEIFREAGIAFSREVADTLVFVGGQRKLFSIVDSNYWVIDNAGAILELQQGQFSVRVGGADLSSMKGVRSFILEFYCLIVEEERLWPVRCE